MASTSRRSCRPSAPNAVTRKHLVIDANILIRAVLGTKVFTLLDTFADRIAFVTAQVAFDDAARHLPGVLF